MAHFDRDATGGQQWTRDLPIYAAAANIKRGAFIRWGTTDGTNQGFAIPCPVNTSLGSEFIGVTEAAFAGATLDNDPSAGTKYLLTPCTINPHAIYMAKFDNSFGANALTATSATAGSKTVVVTSGENLGGGWLMFDNYELHYVLSSSSGTYTLLSALSAAISTSNKVAKLLYPSATKVSLSADFSYFATNITSAGAVEMTVIDLFVKAKGIDYGFLDPTKHDGLILPSTGFTPYVEAAVQSTAHFLL